MELQATFIHMELVVADSMLNKVSYSRKNTKHKILLSTSTSQNCSFHHMNSPQNKV